MSMAGRLGGMHSRRMDGRLQSELRRLFLGRIRVRCLLTARRYVSSFFVEDDLSNTRRPRLQLSEGNVRKVFSIQSAVVRTNYLASINPGRILLSQVFYRKRPKVLSQPKIPTPAKSTRQITQQSVRSTSHRTVSPSNSFSTHAKSAPQKTETTSPMNSSKKASNPKSAR